MLKAIANIMSRVGRGAPPASPSPAASPAPHGSGARGGRRLVVAKFDSAQTTADNDESVALGLARTGRVITAAALVMSISFAALIAAKVSFMRMFGTGLALAVLVDATLVRMVMVPAFMHVLGRWNWWAPKPLTRLHQRFGISESGNQPDPDSTAVPAADPR